MADITDPVNIEGVSFSDTLAVLNCQYNMSGIITAKLGPTAGYAMNMKVYNLIKALLATQAQSAVVTALQNQYTEPLPPVVIAPKPAIPKA